jgi:hypothetical protein
MADPQLTLAWWDKNRPKTLPSTGFGDSLKKYEAALKAFEAGTKPGASANVKELHDKLDKALDAVTAGAADATRKCNKTLHKDAIKVLGLVTTKTIPGEKKRIDAAFAHYRMVQKSHADDVKKFYDVREKIVQDLTKNFGAAKKGADDLNSTMNELAGERQRIVDAAKKGTKPAQAVVDKFVKAATKAKQDSEAWLKQMTPIIQAKWPQVDPKKLSDGERKQFNAQSDKRDNSLTVLNSAHISIERGAKYYGEMIKQVEAAAK